MGTEIRPACFWARISRTGCSFPETVEIAFIICDLEPVAPGSDVIAYSIYGDDGAAEVLPGPALVCGRAFIGLGLKDQPSFLALHPRVSPNPRH